MRVVELALQFDRGRRLTPPGLRQIQMLPASAVVHKYPDSPDCADGRTLIIGSATKRKMRVRSRRYVLFGARLTDGCRDTDRIFGRGRPGPLGGCGLCQ
jgi:hypothetical protein